MEGPSLRGPAHCPHLPQCILNSASCTDFILAQGNLCVLGHIIKINQAFRFYIFHKQKQVRKMGQAVTTTYAVGLFSLDYIVSGCRLRLVFEKQW